VQVDFLASEAAQMGKRNEQARQAVLDFQSKEGMVSPDGTLEAVAGTIAQLESRKSALQTQLARWKPISCPAIPTLWPCASRSARSMRNWRASGRGPPRPIRRAQPPRRCLPPVAAGSPVQPGRSTRPRWPRWKRADHRDAGDEAGLRDPGADPARISRAPAPPLQFLVFTLAAFAAAAVALLLVSVVRDHID
jgi:capsular polysaccharide transport system permease protein